METNVSIYDRSTLLGVVGGDARSAWRTARAVVNSLAHDAGPGMRFRAHREWYRTPGRAAYQRGMFRAVNTFRAVSP